MVSLSVTIIDAVIALAYLMEGIKGHRDLPYTAIVMVLCIIPVALAWFFYSKDKSHWIIRHAVGLGFAVLYIFVLFTAANNLVFTYAIPMLLIVTLYMDKGIQP